LDEIETGGLNERGEKIHLGSGGNPLTDAFPKRCVRMAGDESEGRSGAGLRVLSGEVVALVGDDMAHAASRIGHVAVVSGNDVDMNMKDRLPGTQPGVESDVPSVRTRIQFLREARLHFSYKRHHGCLLLGRGVEVGRDNPARDNERVAGRHREPIKKCDRQ